jgi:hypothetical protein
MEMWARMQASMLSAMNPSATGGESPKDKESSGS